MTAVELDRRLAELLPVTAAAMGAPEGSLEVVAADAMDVTELPGEPTALVANLPYNVSVPVLLHFLEAFPAIGRGLVMVQAEVGHRLAAPPGSKTDTLDRVLAAWYADVRVVSQVSRSVFWPVPNVDSVLVRFDRHDQPGDERDRVGTFAIIDAAFGQRRKMLRQSLIPVLGAGAAEVIERAGVDPTARGEVLGILDFLRIADARVE